MRLQRQCQAASATSLARATGPIQETEVFNGRLGYWPWNPLEIGSVEQLECSGKNRLIWFSSLYVRAIGIVSADRHMLFRIEIEIRPNFEKVIVFSQIIKATGAFKRPPVA